MLKFFSLASSTIRCPAASPAMPPPMTTIRFMLLPIEDQRGMIEDRDCPSSIFYFRRLSLVARQHRRSFEQTSDRHWDNSRDKRPCHDLERSSSSRCRDRMRPPRDRKQNRWAQQQRQYASRSRVSGWHFRCRAPARDRLACRCGSDTQATTSLDGDGQRSVARFLEVVTHTGITPPSR